MGDAPFCKEDVPTFLALAAEEGWICAPWEFEFLLKNFPQGCLTWREHGVALGYVTSIRYGKSGWIGNLLVPPSFRKKGIGRVLMEQAVTVLLKSGVETVWLTASSDGAGLYRKLGFVEVDSIWRWSGSGCVNREAAGPVEYETVRGIDRAGWGDRRDALLRVTLARGAFFSTSAGFLCCQRWQNGIQIGPWGCLVGAQAAGLFDRAIGKGEERIVLDVPSANREAAAILKESGFTVRGTNLLMYLGVEPQYRPQNVFALGSMGSMG